MPDYPNLFIDGEWIAPAAGTTFIDLAPATRQPWGEIADASVADVQRALDVAAAAQPAWEAAGPMPRADLLNRVAAVIQDRAPQLAEVLIHEVGSIRAKAMGECMAAGGFAKAAAATAWAVKGSVLPSLHDKLNIIERKPVGVVSVISPWNVPFSLSMRSVAYALALGNTVVLKPSEESPVSGGLMLAEVFEAAGCPPGVLNVVSCSRANVAEIGELMVAHPAVGTIAFTGSEAVGRILGAAAGRHLKKADLELGGNDAAIILADADLDAALDATVFGAFQHAGQICMATKRIIVEEPIAEEFTGRLVERVRALKYGDPTNPDTAVGPIINDEGVAKLADAIDDAKAKGAEVLVGGGVEGPYVQPTLLAGVGVGMKAHSEELFGPVRAVYTAADADEALAIANDSDYGLSGAIWTEDEQRGLDLAARFETGMVHINDTTISAEPHVPFGGVKSSGIGRNGGEGSIEAFTETVWRGVRRSPPPIPPMFRG